MHTRPTSTPRVQVTVTIYIFLKIFLIIYYYYYFLFLSLPRKLHLTIFNIAFYSFTNLLIIVTCLSLSLWKKAFSCILLRIIIIIQELQIRRQIYVSTNRPCSQNLIGKSFHASSNLFLNESIDLACTISVGSSFQFWSFGSRKKFAWSPLTPSLSAFHTTW